MAVSWPRWPGRSSKSRGPVTPVSTRSLGFATSLYIDDMRASISAKKEPAAGSPIARRCAFVWHLRNAENSGAVIRLLAFISNVPSFLFLFRCLRVLPQHLVVNALCQSFGGRGIYQTYRPIQGVQFLVGLGD